MYMKVRSISERKLAIKTASKRQKKRISRILMAIVLNLLHHRVDSFIWRAFQV